MGNKPLAGKKILITRAREQSAEFASSLKNLGAEGIEFPTIEIRPPLSWDALDRAIQNLNTYDWLIFTSANGVRFFFERLKKKRENLPSSLKVCAIGPATAKELNKREIQIDYIPKEFIAEAILDGFKEMQVKGKKILLARAEKARDILPNGLKEMGAEVEVVEVYRTIKPKGGAKRLKLLLKEKIDAIAFTSSSTVDHFVDLLKGVDHKKALKGVAIACIGPITADTARKRGMKVHIQPKEYTIPGLTQAIAKYFTKITNRQSPKK